MERFFWQRLADFGEQPALLDEQGAVFSYRQLSYHVEYAATQFHAPSRKLIFLAAHNDIGAVQCYLGALSARQPVFIARSGIPNEQLLKAYRPDIVLWKGGGRLSSDYEEGGTLFGYNVARSRENGAPIGQDLALLLSTSGSLQSPKVVRLSWNNVGIAAQQVAQSLRIKPGDRAITSLPLAFVYGLSIVNSNLQAGASVVVSGRSIQDPAFWRLIDLTATTTISGVPWTYKGMRSVGFDPINHPTVSNLSLSGGALDVGTRQWLLAMVRSQGTQFFSMYGQTEAGGRMCVLSPEKFIEIPESVGQPVPGGCVFCDASGNVVYRGANVMLGYAHGRQSLSGADDMNGVLPTGDTGHLDAEGNLYLSGRTSRTAKLFGLRLNLDEIEALFSSVRDVAAICCDDHLTIYLEGEPIPEFSQVLKRLVFDLRVPPHHVHLRYVQALPHTQSGKISYADLAGAVPLAD